MSGEEQLRSDEMDDAEFDEALWAATSGDLRERHLSRLRAELRSDPRRRELADQMRALQDALPLYEVPEPSADFTGRCLERWNRECGSERRGDAHLLPAPGRIPWYRRSLRIPVPLAALLVLGIGFTIYILGPSSGDLPGPSTPTALPPDPSVARPADRDFPYYANQRLIIGAIGSQASLFELDMEEGFLDGEPISEEPGEHTSPGHTSPGQNDPATQDRPGRSDRED